MEQLQEWYELVRPYSHYVTIILICSITCLVYDLIAHKARQRKRVAMLSPKDRKKEVRVIMADRITDALEDLYYSDKITRDERDQWYVMIGSRCDLPDLLPKYKVNHPHPEDLKEAIKDRLERPIPTIMRLRAILNRA